MLAPPTIPCSGRPAHNRPMRAWMRWTVGLGGAAVLLGAGAVAGLSQWASSDDFRTRAQQAASQALGVPVQLGRIDVTLWPLPAVALREVRVQTQPPLTLAQVDATPLWSSLLVGRPALDALVVREAVLPQVGLLALAAGLQKQAPATPAATPLALPRRIVLDKVTWIDAARQALTVDAEISFGDAPLPQAARIAVVAGRFAGAHARLDRDQDAWQLRAEIGGGTLAGPLRLAPQRGGGWRLSGELATDRVEVAALTAPSRTLTGKLDARTTLQADFKDPGGLADAMRTQTRLTVRKAVIHGIDLAQAVRTLGISRSGNTALDTLTGQVTTQGRAVQMSNLVATSGSLSATGDVRLAPDRTLNGRVVAALGGIAGVPLQVGGTLDAPTASPAGLTVPAVQGLGDAIGKGFQGLFGK